MLTIDPKRLLELRNRRRLSRQALAAKAHVSPRQLARIETEDVQVRTTTLERLARALDVDGAVILGEEPLPADDDEESPLEIDPQNLRVLREDEQMSRRQLAEKSGVSERQLARLESSRKAVRPTTFKRIEEALGTDSKKLSGATPLQPTPAARESVNVGLRVSPQLRLAYDLVGVRYGPTRRQLFELAPLLFVLLAEGSLAWRKERVGEVEELVDRLSELGKYSQLYFARYVEDMRAAADVEQDSIKDSTMRADVLGDEVRDDDFLHELFAPGHVYEVAPFADYLCKLAEDLGVGGIVDFDSNDFDSTVGYNTIWGAKPYEVCKDLLVELTGGSKYARWALLHGDVQLSKMPQDLLKPEAKDARVAWLESKLSDEVRSRQDDLESMRRTLVAVIREGGDPSADQTGEAQ